MIFVVEGVPDEAKIKRDLSKEAPFDLEVI